MSDCACTTAYMCNIHRRPIKDIHTTGGVVGGHLGSPTPKQIDSAVGFIVNGQLGGLDSNLFKTQCWRCGRSLKWPEVAAQMSVFPQEKEHSANYDFCRQCAKEIILKRVK